jgi:hypothetical protein
MCGEGNVDKMDGLWYDIGSWQACGSETLFRSDPTTIYVLRSESRRLSKPERESVSAMSLPAMRRTAAFCISGEES